MKKGDKVIWEETNATLNVPHVAEFKAMFSATISALNSTKNLADLIDIRLHSYESAEGFGGTMQIDSTSSQVDTSKLKLMVAPEVKSLI